MIDYYEVDECLQGLTILLYRSEILPDYICSSENYPVGKTTVISDIKLSSFEYIIGEAMHILEHIKGVEMIKYATWVNNTFCSNCKSFPVDVSVPISNQELTKYFSRCPHCGAHMRSNHEHL